MSSLKAPQSWSPAESPSQNALPVGSNVHVASQADTPVSSPVAALQAQLAAGLDEIEDRARLDLTWPLVWLFCAASWWGIISSVIALVRGYQGS